MQQQSASPRHNGAGSELPFAGSLQEIARGVVKFRERRRHVLGKANFSDPAWDLLLLLAANDSTPEGLTAEFVADKIGTSPAVVERFARLLQIDGMVKLQAGPDRNTIRMTAHGARTLQKLIS